MPDAVAITVNSPGGSPVQSDLIYTRVRALAKETGIPVFTFAEDVAASGGYYLLAAGDDAIGASTLVSMGLRLLREASVALQLLGGGAGSGDQLKHLEEVVVLEFKRQVRFGTDISLFGLSSSA